MHPAAADNANGRALFVLLLLFMGSGCAALIYEIVWFQLLQLSIGSSAVSLAVLLATFMGGLCLGSLLCDRFVGPGRHPLAVYAGLEFGIAACGLVILHAAPRLGAGYDALGISGYPGICCRGLVAAICLLPPTLLMGATLPAAARFVEATPAGVAWLGWLYGGNTFGAVAGCLLAGFCLLRFFDVTVATWAAAALNICVGAVALLLARNTRHAPPPVADPAHAERTPRDVLFAIGFSGFAALAAELVWTRLLSLQLGATVYTFSLILAAFLAGLGIGSLLAGRTARDPIRARVALGACQLAVGAAIAWAAWQVSACLPRWQVDPSPLGGTASGFGFDLLRCLWVVLPAACLWGASFPLAIGAVSGRGRDAAPVVGIVSAANTLGAIAGAVASGLLVWWLGSQSVQRLLIAVSALSGLAMVAPLAHRRWPAAIALAAAGCGIWLVPPVSPAAVAYGRHSGRLGGRDEIFYVGEGLQAAVAVSRTPEGRLHYHNAGKVQASSAPQDMRLQRMLGHLTTLVPADPRTVLVIGFGAGVTAGAVSIDPRVKEETVVEIEPLVPVATAAHFSDHNEAVATNPKVRIQIDDARHYLLTTRETFDAITSDPLDPWVKGAATLYTREFFEAVKGRLNEGGVFTLFVQLYETTEEAVKSELATFFAVFPHGMVFANTLNGRGYDLVLLGQAGPTVIDVDELEEKLARPEMAPVARSLREAGFTSAIDLCATFAGRAADLEPWLRDATINRDGNLRLQYLAGLGLDRQAGEAIYAALRRNVAGFPEDVFTGSNRSLMALEHALYKAERSQARR